jgi:hypothetical protein
MHYHSDWGRHSYSVCVSWPPYGMFVVGEGDSYSPRPGEALGLAAVAVRETQQAAGIEPSLALMLDMPLLAPRPTGR